jgi:hypothetical protein
MPAIASTVVARRPATAKPPRRRHVPPRDGQGVRYRRGSATLYHHPASSDFIYTDEESAFLRACTSYRAAHHLGFLGPVHCLHILLELGYRRPEPPRSVDP